MVDFRQEVTESREGHFKNSDLNMKKWVSCQYRPNVGLLLLSSNERHVSLCRNRRRGGEKTAGQLESPGERKGSSLELTCRN